MSRAIRRHHRARLLNKRKDNWGGYFKDDPKLAKVVDTPTPCSCWMCANERRGNRRQDKTMQELRQETDMQKFY
jgi:hypothetical protein